MLRQICEALRCSIADFFDVPWQGVATLLATVILLATYAYLRTVYSWSDFRWLKHAMLLGALIALIVGGQYLRKR